MSQVEYRVRWRCRAGVNADQGRESYGEQMYSYWTREDAERIAQAVTRSRSDQLVMGPVIEVREIGEWTAIAPEPEPEKRAA